MILKGLWTQFSFIGVYTDLKNLLESNQEGDYLKSPLKPSMSIKKYIWMLDL